MRRTLKRHGNGYALVVERAVMELLLIGPETALDIRTDGTSLIVTPAKGSKSRDLCSAKPEMAVADA